MTDPVRRDDKSPAADDDSAVRERSTPSDAPRPGASVSAGAARERLERKLRQGRAILATLSGSDDRARLLSVALMRRDESLLDGVLSALGASPESSPPSKPSGKVR